jgi:hypothetical protein
MNAVTKAESTAVDQSQVGLYHKFNVERTDGSSAPGGKHHSDEYFVLNLTTDRHALPALKAYAKSCANDFPALAADLRAKVRALMPSEFVTVPETTLPNGLVVPEFTVGRYLCTVDESGKATVAADAVPTVKINYHDAVKACDASGLKLIRETQALALSWNIYNQDANWTGGKVGEGSLFQGLHDDTVDGAQPNDYEPEEESERRWFVLSNGERIYDVAGHLFTWVFDDVQGDEKGLIAKPFTKESPSISTCPDASMKKGTGWRPSLPYDWSGFALVRGGFWRSVDLAGVFRLGDVWPGDDYYSVGFRCTKP